MLSRDKDKLFWSKILMLGSLGALALAVSGSMGSDIYLASTQWMLVAIALGVWAIYCLVEAQFKLRK